MVGIKTDRCAVLVGGPVKTKHNHSQFADSRVGRRGGCFQMKQQQPDLWMHLHSTLESVIKQGDNTSLSGYGLMMHSTFSVADFTAVFATNVLNEKYSTRQSKPSGNMISAHGHINRFVRQVLYEPIRACEAP